MSICQRVGLSLGLRRHRVACQHKRVALLSDAEIEEKLAGLSGWERQGEAIEKSFKRGDFVGSVRSSTAWSSRRRR